MSTILLAGGAGYIGSHTAVELINAGYDVIVADNYANSSPESISRVEKITGKKIALYEADVSNAADMEKIFSKEHIDAEAALAFANRKFRSRWASMESAAKASGKPLDACSDEEFDQLWGQAKQEERGQ